MTQISRSRRIYDALQSKPLQGQDDEYRAIYSCCGCDRLYTILDLAPNAPLHQGSANIFDPPLGRRHPISSYVFFDFATQRCGCCQDSTPSALIYPRCRQFPVFAKSPHQYNIEIMSLVVTSKEFRPPFSS